jgi:glycerol-3-phosphate acyltransferase PlsY
LLPRWTKIRDKIGSKIRPMIWIFNIIISYLLGSVPSGYLVAKSRGIDIRQHGSKNIGATNVLRVMGKKWGYFVFFCDGLKGFVSVKLGFLLAGFFGANVMVAGLVAALCCILGHNYPIWLGFKGGKGIATSAGVVIALFPPVIVLLVGIVWLLVFWFGRYVSLASMAAAAALPIAVTLFGPYVAINDYWLVLCFAVLAAALAIWRHRANINRLLNGTESRFGKRNWNHESQASGSGRTRTSGSIYSSSLFALK